MTVRSTTRYWANAPSARYEDFYFPGTFGARRDYFSITWNFCCASPFGASPTAIFYVEIFLGYYEPTDLYKAG